MLATVVRDERHPDYFFFFFFFFSVLCVCFGCWRCELWSDSQPGYIYFSALIVHVSQVAGVSDRVRWLRVTLTKEDNCYMLRGQPIKADVLSPNLSLRQWLGPSTSLFPFLTVSRKFKPLVTPSLEGRHNTGSAAGLPRTYPSCMPLAMQFQDAEKNTILACSLFNYIRLIVNVNFSGIDWQLAWFRKPKLIFFSTFDKFYLIS